jgi:hypothetical protein
VVPASKTNRAVPSASFIEFSPKFSLLHLQRGQC